MKPPHVRTPGESVFESRGGLGSEFFEGSSIIGKRLTLG